MQSDPSESSTADSSIRRQRDLLSSAESSTSYVLQMEQALSTAPTRSRGLSRSSTKVQAAAPTTWSTSLPWQQYRPDPEPPPGSARCVEPNIFYSEGASGPEWRREGAKYMKALGDYVGDVLDGLGLGRLGQAAGTCLSNGCCLCPQPKAESFASNEVITAKYSIISFVPINLFEQFQRIANLYFLLVVILMNIPGLAVVSSVTTIIPLVFVLLINAVKEAHDDIKRHRNDAMINAQRTQQLAVDRKEPLQIPWREVQVGHVLKVEMNESIPADMILLQSSDPDNLCYLETSNLDGETNLKLKYCYPGTSNLDPSELMKQLKEMHIECEHPQASLYTYEGTMAYSGGTRDPLTSDNLLLRGCTLRNAQWIIGLVVFTGRDTKIMLNAVPAPRKVSRLERTMNHMVVCMFLFQLLIAALCALGTVTWAKVNAPEELWYIRGNATDWDDSSAGTFFLSWIRYVLLMNQMIPISLYVTLELVKVSQCVLLYNGDLQMYHKDTDTPFTSRTTTLNEELGQVKYVLSDKTGTLTQNVMGFIMASVGGHIYGCHTPETPPCSQFLDFLPHTLAWDLELRNRLGDYTPPGPDLPLSLVASTRFTSRQERERQRALADLDEFMLAIALCNTVVPTVDAVSGLLYYQATSPDEEALVQGAAYLGYTLLARTTMTVEVAVNAANSPRYKQENKFQVMAILEFDSDRKRMSIILREVSNNASGSSSDDSGSGIPTGAPQVGRIRLYCKGADSVIAARLADTPSVRGGKGSELHTETQRHLDVMAQGGYRTLSFAHRDLSEREFQDWYRRYQEAAVATNGREQKIAALGDEIERDLLLDGATGVEDKLQDRVPEAIEELGRAGIKVWVLTGDKLETAISIAGTCRLFNEGMHIERICEQDLSSEDPTKFFKSRAQKINGMVTEGTRVGLVIDGAALHIALKESCQTAFLALCLQVHSVVCCRVSPMQKADITRLVRDKAGAVTLGIGDGANDVSMIKAAHVGCGISGREGRTAVLAADYAFAQFHYLVRLLLVHGRAAYKRNSLTVLYSFYKNFMYCLPFAFAGTVSGFSCLPIYPEAMLTTYNAVWTALPIVAYAVFEQDVSLDYIADHPELYHETMDEGRLQFALRLGGWLLVGAYHAVVAFTLPLFTMARHTAVDASGNHYAWYDVGTTIFTAVFLIATLKVATKTRYWTAFNLGSVGVTLAMWVPFLLIMTSLVPRFTSPFFLELSGVWMLLGGPHFWMVGVVLAPLAALLPDLASDVARQDIRKEKLEPYSWDNYYTFAHGRLRALYGPLSKAPAWDGRTSRTASKWSPTDDGSSQGVAALRSLSLSFPVSDVSFPTSSEALHPIDESDTSSLLQSTDTPLPERGALTWDTLPSYLPYYIRFKTRGLRVDHNTLRQSGTKQQLMERSGSSIMVRELIAMDSTLDPQYSNPQLNTA